MPITDAEVRNAKPKEKGLTNWPGGGFYLLVTPAGKYFLFD